MTAGEYSTRPSAATGERDLRREHATRTGRHEVHGRSVGDLISEVSNDLSTLMRQELRAGQGRGEGRRPRRPARPPGCSAVPGSPGTWSRCSCLIALWWALANGMDEGWAALIVAALWAVVGAVLYSMGRARLAPCTPKPERTVQTLKEVPDALKGN